MRGDRSAARLRGATSSSSPMYGKSAEEERAFERRPRRSARAPSGCRGRGRRASRTSRLSPALPARSRRRGMASHASAAASAPTAAPIASALCQPNASLAKPATIEPSICPEMIANSMRPIITWRSLMSKRSPRPARTSGIRPPAKMPARDARREQEREGRRERAEQQHRREAGDADLDAARLAEAVADRAEERLRDRVRQRVGGVEHRRASPARPRSAARSAATSGSTMRSAKPLANAHAAKTRKDRRHAAPTLSPCGRRPGRARSLATVAAAPTAADGARCVTLRALNFARSRCPSRCPSFPAAPSITFLRTQERDADTDGAGPADHRPGPAAQALEERFGADAGCSTTTRS